MTDDTKKSGDPKRAGGGKLPPSGLAKDILARYESSRAAETAQGSKGEKKAADTASKESAPKGATPKGPATKDAAPKDAAPKEAKDGAAAGEAGSDGAGDAAGETAGEDGLSTPERVYAFTDSLEIAAEEEKLKETPETHVTFYLADEIFTLPVIDVQEVVRVTGITRVPHAPFPVRGITTLRGQILPVVDLRLRLGLSEVPTSELSRILVLQSRGRKIGLLVDRVREVVRLLPSHVQSPPADVMTEQSEYIIGVYPHAESLLILLDLDKVLLIPESLEASRVHRAGSDRPTNRPTAAPPPGAGRRRPSSPAFRN